MLEIDKLKEAVAAWMPINERPKLPLAEYKDFFEYPLYVAVLPEILMTKSVNMLVPVNPSIPMVNRQDGLVVFPLEVMPLTMSSPCNARSEEMSSRLEVRLLFTPKM